MRPLNDCQVTGLAISSGVVYVGTQDGSLVSFNPQTTLIVADVGTAQGAVIALSAQPNLVFALQVIYWLQPYV
jgi:outer membrane protein assembly factor BamB